MTSLMQVPTKEGGGNYLFIMFLPVLSLHWCAGFFLVALHRLLTEVASLVAELRL